MVNLAGIQYDEAGYPVPAGFVVTAHAVSDAGVVTESPVATTTTDAKGRWAFTGLAAGYYEVRVHYGPGTHRLAGLRDEQVRDLDVRGALVVGGSAVGQTNLLTNGGFEVWQRGAGPFTGNIYSADRWAWWSAAGTAVVSREITIKKADSRYSAVVSVAAAETGSLYQRLVIADGFHHLRGRTVSLTLSLNTGTAAKSRAFIGCDGTGGGYAYSGYAPGDATWREYAVSMAVPADASYVDVGVSAEANVGAYAFYVDNAMLVLGSVPATYAGLHPAEEFARCQRYYEVQGGVTETIQYHVWSGGNLYQGFGRQMTQKAAAPTATKRGTWAVTNCSQPVADAPGLGTYRIYVLATAAGDTWFGTDSADDTITLEANPT